MYGKHLLPPFQGRFLQTSLHSQQISQNHTVERHDLTEVFRPRPKKYTAIFRIYIYIYIYIYEVTWNYYTLSSPFQATFHLKTRWGTASFVSAIFTNETRNWFSPNLVRTMCRWRIPSAIIFNFLHLLMSTWQTSKLRRWCHVVPLNSTYLSDAVVPELEYNCSPP